MSTGPVIGQATIRVGADASGMDKAIKQQGQNSGEAFNKRFGSAVVVGAKVAGAGIAAVMGASLVKGFGRLTAIDNAQKKLEGLGHSAGEVELIMENALASVKGTAFGLGEAATYAATMVAAGVKPGEDLTRALSLMGDAATIAGVPLGEMGSLFSKVSAQGKLTGETLSSMTDRGIPALQWIADEFGVTAEAAREMVSNGEIDFATFQDLLENNIGGAALKSGETFQGGMANVGAALGRLGATVLGPLFEEGPGVFASLIDAMDAMAPAAEKVGEALKVLFDAAAAVFGFLASQSDWIVPLVAALGSMAAAVWAVSFAFKAIAFVRGLIMGIQLAWIALNVAFAASPIGFIIVLIVGLVAGLVVLWMKSEAFRNFFIGIWDAIKTAVSAIKEWFTGTLVPALQNAWDRIVSAIEAVWNVVKIIIGLWIILMFGWAILIWKAVTFVWDKIGPYVKQVLDWIIGKVKDWIAKIIATWDRIKELWNKVKEVFSGLWSTVTDWLSRIWNKIVDWVSNITKPFRDAVSRMKDVGKDFIRGIWDGIKSMGSWLWDKVSGFVSDNLPGPVKKALGISSPSKVMAEYGRDAVAGMAKGIDSSADLVAKAAEGMAMTVPMGVTAAGGRAGAGTSTTTTTVNVTVSMDDLAQLGTLEEFLRMIQSKRVDERRGSAVVV